MRDELALAATARRLRAAGLVWQPQPGDWCALLDGSRAGLWLVVEADAAVGWATIVATEARWPPARVAAQDALWLPTVGQLKAWLRAHGWRVSTQEVAPPAAVPGWAAGLPGMQAGAASPFAHRCVAVHPARPGAIQTAGLNEAEAVAEAVIVVAALPG